MADGPVGQRDEWVRLTPRTARGHASLARDKGLTDGYERVEHQDITSRLAELRGRGLVVMRENS